MGLRCKRCGSEKQVKNGLMRGKQRYLCKGCGLNFTDTPARGKPLALKAAAVLLYVSGLSMNRTAKLLGVSTPTIQAWLEQFAAAYAQKPEPAGRAGGFYGCIDGLSSWLMRIAREIGRGTSVQALRERTACQERADARQAALLVQRLRPELHRHASPGQAAGPEGGCGPALRQRLVHEPHRPAAGRLHAHHPGLAGAVRGRLRPEARAGRTSGGDRARRDVALSEKKSRPLWIWKDWDRATGQLVDWECGGRDKVTCERLIERLRRWRTRLFCADDYT